MYFWNIEKLAEKLANGAISESEKARYLLGVFIVSTLINYAYAFIGEPPNYRDTDRDISTALALAIKIAVDVAGFILLFNVHSQQCSNGFLDKVVCFGLPAAIRTVVIGWFGVAGVFMAISFVFDAERVSMAIDLLSPARPIPGVIYFNVLYFKYMYRGFSNFNEKKIARTSES